MNGLAGQAERSAVDMAKIVQERDQLRQLDKERRKTLHEQRTAFEVQLRELEERLWGEVQDKLTETKRREDVELSEQAAVQELLRLRASMSLPPSAVPALEVKKRGTEDLGVMYKQAQDDLRQQTATQLKALAQEVQECRQELIFTQSDLADEVATQRAVQPGSTGFMSPAAASEQDGKVLILIFEPHLRNRCFKVFVMVADASRFPSSLLASRFPSSLLTTVLLFV